MIKTFLKVVLLIVFFLIVTAYFFSNFLLNTSYSKKQIASLISSSSEFELEEINDIDLKWYPGLYLKLEKIKLSSKSLKINNNEFFIKIPLKSLLLAKPFIINELYFDKLDIIKKDYTETKDKKSENIEINLPNIKKLTLKNTNYFIEDKKIINFLKVDISNIGNKENTKLNSTFNYLNKKLNLSARTNNLKKLVNGNKSNLDLKLIEANKEIEAKGFVNLNENLFDYKLNGKAFSGNFNGELKFSEFIDFKLIANNLDSQEIEEEFKLSKLLTGLINIELDLINQDYKKDLKNISGIIKINSDHLNISNNKLKLATNSLHRILKPILGGTKSESECALFNFELKNGHLISKEQAIKVGNVFIFPEGDIDFNSNKIKYHFNVNSSSPSFASLIPPFKAIGKLDNISFLPSISGTTSSLLDSAEGILGSARKVVTDLKNIITLKTNPSLTGVNLCKDAYKKEQKLISSQIGNFLKK